MPVIVTLVTEPPAPLKKRPFNVPLAQLGSVNPVPMIVRFSTFIDVPALVTTPPSKDPGVVSWAVMVCSAPLTVIPSGTVSGAVASQLEVNVNVDPLKVPAQVSMLGSVAAPATPPPVSAIGRRPAETTLAKHARPIRKRTMAMKDPPTSRSETSEIVVTLLHQVSK